MVLFTGDKCPKMGDHWSGRSDANRIFAIYSTPLLPVLEQLPMAWDKLRVSANTCAIK